MDYEEFRWAMGDQTTVPLLQQAFATKHALGDAAHRKIMRDLRLYMLVGGMPQAVNTYLDTQNLSLVDGVKREILELYNDDFYKIDSTGKAASMFKAIPAQLYGNAHRYQTTPVIGEVEDDTLLTLIHEMEESNTVNIAHHVDDPNVGLPMTDNLGSFKMYVGDTGLFVTLAFADKDVTENQMGDCGGLCPTQSPIPLSLSSCRPGRLCGLAGTHITQTYWAGQLCWTAEYG